MTSSSVGPLQVLPLLLSVVRLVGFPRRLRLARRPNPRLLLTVLLPTVVVVVVVLL